MLTIALHGCAVRGATHPAHAFVTLPHFGSDSAAEWLALSHLSGKRPTVPVVFAPPARLSSAMAHATAHASVGTAACKQANEWWRLVVDVSFTRGFFQLSPADTSYQRSLPIMPITLHDTGPALW